MSTIYIKSESKETLASDFATLGYTIPEGGSYLSLPCGILEVVGLIPVPLTEAQEADNLQAQMNGAPLPHQVSYLEGYHANLYCEQEAPDLSGMQHSVCVSPDHPYRTKY